MTSMTSSAREEWVDELREMLRHRPRNVEAASKVSKSDASDTKLLDCARSSGRRLVGREQRHCSRGVKISGVWSASGLQ